MVCKLIRRMALVVWGDSWRSEEFFQVGAAGESMIVATFAWFTHAVSRRCDTSMSSAVAFRDASASSNSRVYGVRASAGNSRRLSHVCYSTSGTKQGDRRNSFSAHSGFRWS